jgi:hypothetical protein
VNMVVSEGGGTTGYGNFLPTVLSVCSSPEWWIDTGVNIHVCADISMFSSYQVGGGLPPCKWGAVPMRVFLVLVWSL